MPEHDEQFTAPTKKRTVKAYMPEHNEQFTAPLKKRSIKPEQDEQDEQFTAPLKKRSSKPEQDEQDEQFTALVALDKHHRQAYVPGLPAEVGHLSNALFVHLYTHEDYTWSQLLARPAKICELVAQYSNDPANRAIWTGVVGGDSETSSAKVKETSSAKVVKRAVEGGSPSEKVKRAVGLHEPKVTKDGSEVSDVVPGRGWQVSITPTNDFLEADTILCPTFVRSRTYRDGKTMAERYKTDHLKWRAKRDKATWEHYDAFLQLTRLLNSGELRYRWKSTNGNVSVEELLVFAQESTTGH